MADIIKTITLTSLGSNAGPLFDVYYSNDCISYTQSVDGNNVSLPYIGATINVTIPDTTSCIKLVNLSAECGMNEYVEVIQTTTTSTTTTAGPYPCGVAYYTVIQSGYGTNNYSYKDVLGVTRSGSLGQFQNIMVGAQPGFTTIAGLESTIRESSIDFCTQSFECNTCNTLYVTNSYNGIQEGKDIVLFYVNCGTNSLTSSLLKVGNTDPSPYPVSASYCACTSVYQLVSGSDGSGSLTVGGVCSSTTTSTTTTSTTSTSTSTTSTTTAAPVIEYWSGSYCNNGNPVPTLLKATSSLSTGNVVNFGTNDPETCVTLTDRYYGTPFFSLTINRLYANCFVCQGITTSTTTSTSTTTTLGPSYCWKIVNTTEGSLNVEYYNTINEPVIIGVPGGSTDYICAYGGTTPTGDTGVTIEACGTICTSSDSCTGCTPPTTTTTSTTSTTTTSTSTSTTTSTTTLAPVNFTNPSFVCNDTPYGETPTATVTVTGFTGGSGTYQITNTLYLSEAAALAGTFIDATAPVDYFAVENNTWWVAVRDKNNTSNKVAKSVVVSCAEPTTTTTTTSTTTSTTTTSTSTTTTLAPVNGTTSFTCNDTPYGETPTATVSINTLTGGSGVYQVTNTLYLSEAGALGGTYIDAGTLPINYFAVENNTWWVGIRDKNNTANKIAKQIVVSCSAGTTTSTTTTTSTSTTTTQAPGIQFGVSLTTKYATDSLACAGTVTGVIYQPPIYGTTPANGAQLYTDSAMSTTWTPSAGAGIYLFQYGGSTKWAVFVGSSGVISGVTACSGLTTTSTTTTTTTAAPATTTTTTQLPYAYIEIFNDTETATISGVAVEGVAIDAAFFPLSPGDNTSGTTTNIGASQTVTITYSGATGDYVEIIDTATNQNCGVATGTGKTFNGQVISGAGTVYITMGEGSCP